MTKDNEGKRPTIDDHGRKVRDTITGFARYITGCDTILIAPPVDKEGKHVEGRWFDENRVELLDAERVKVDTTDANGPCEPAPIK